MSDQTQAKPRGTKRVPRLSPVVVGPANGVFLFLVFGVMLHTPLARYVTMTLWLALWLVVLAVVIVQKGPAAQNEKDRSDNPAHEAG